jgi:hypothetical protein
MVVVEPGDPCDRCGHESRRHAMPVDGSICIVKDGRGKRCLCDGFWPIAADRRKAARA